MITFVLNGESFDFDGDPATPLLWVLRDHAGLKGTKFGCGTGLCGTCTVHLDDSARPSCVIPIAAVAGKQVRTIEGLSSDGSHPLQQAWIEEDVSQCGYCQVGQIMHAADWLQRVENPTDEDIERYQTPLCRCGTYTRIRKAIARAAAQRQEGSAAWSDEPAKGDLA